MARAGLANAQALCDTSHCTPYAINALANRLNQLELAMLGADNVFALPGEDPVPPIKLKSIAPGSGWLDRESWFVLEWNGGECQQRPQVFVGGVPASVEHFQQSQPTPDAKRWDARAVVKLTAWHPQGARGPVDLTVSCSAGTATAPNAVTFRLEKESVPASLASKSRVLVRRLLLPNGATRVESIEVQGEGVTASEVLKALEAPVGGDAAQVDVDVDLRGPTP
jgi:hypothetical protein